MEDATDPKPLLRVRTPRGVAWGVSMIAGAWVLLLVGTAGLGFGIGAGSTKRYMFDALLLIGPVLIAVGAWTAVRARRRLRQIASEREWLLCPTCRYDLRGVHDEATDDVRRCPECGLGASRSEIQRAWQGYA